MNLCAEQACERQQTACERGMKQVGYRFNAERTWTLRVSPALVRRTNLIQWGVLQVLRVTLLAINSAATCEIGFEISVDRGLTTTSDNVATGVSDFW